MNRRWLYSRQPEIRMVLYVQGGRADTGIYMLLGVSLSPNSPKQPSSWINYQFTAHAHRHRGICHEILFLQDPGSDEKG